MKQINRKEWEDHTGKKFGKLTVLGDAEPLNNGKRLVRKMRCMCDCGKEITINLSQLKPWRNSSCGCARNKFPSTHRMTKTRTYRIWWGMVCRGTGLTSRKNYADKGIKVCKRWMKFENFLEDMGERPFPKASIDRIDGTKGYYKENCRWATWDQQARNRCNNHNIEFQGKTWCITDLANEVGICPNTFRSRVIKHGVEKAVNMKIQRTKISVGGEMMYLKRACKVLNQHYGSVTSRIRCGWSVSDALHTPIVKGRKTFNPASSISPSKGA